MSTLPFSNGAGAGAGPRHRHRPSCRINGGPVPSCLCPRCTAKNAADRGKTFVKAKKRQFCEQPEIRVIYITYLKFAQNVVLFLYQVWQIFIPQRPKGPSILDAERLPASSNQITFGLSIQYLIENVIKNQRSFTHYFWHTLGLCGCRDLDEIAKLEHVNFPGLYYRGGFGEFDKFGPMEHAFVVKKVLPTGGETASCVVMQHIYTRRARKFYVFKTVTKDKSLISHPEWGIISNEAYILLGKLKTNFYPHPNIVQLFNSVTSNAIAGIPLHILQMEYCNGGDLWDLNNRCIKHGARVPKSLVAHVFTSLIAALTYLHHGLILPPDGPLKRIILPQSERWHTILHNDIKAENILLRWPAGKPWRGFPEIVLSDFGISGIENKVLGPKGTYRYAAPEVKKAFDLRASFFRHLNFKAADIVNSSVICTTKSDIWGLGAVLEFLFSEYQRVDKRLFRERACVEGGLESRSRAVDWSNLAEIYGERVVGWTRRCLGVTRLGRPSAMTLLGTAVKEIREECRDEGESGGNRLPGWIWA